MEERIVDLNKTKSNLTQERDFAKNETAEIEKQQEEVEDELSQIQRKVKEKY